MNLSSLLFLFIFLPAVMAAYFAVRRWTPRRGNGVLLAASLAFYAWGEPKFIYALAGIALLNWGLGLGMAPGRPGALRKAAFASALSIDIGVLFAYKYFGFVHGNILAALGSNAAPFSLALPLGISFFTFSMVSYAIDVYSGKYAPERHLSNFALYVTFFPKIAVGPISRYPEMAAELASRRETPGDVAAGIGRFVVGFGKKVFFAGHLGIIADNLFLLAEDGHPLSAASAWIGLIAYSLQIYFDFSGYSDMAIGLCRVFGFRIGENFNHPYAATSVTDFWRRWHMSLSSWFRDYVYIPMGGNRRSQPRVIFNLFVVWLLTGVWHGANWTFIAWGLMYFCLLMFERSTGLVKTAGLPLAKRLAMRGWTLLAVALCWAVFRSTSLSDAANYMGLLFGSSGVAFDAMAKSYLVNGGGVMALATICAFPVSNLLEKFAKNRGFTPAYHALCLVFLAATLVLSVLMCFKSSHNPAIYFQF